MFRRALAALAVTSLAFTAVAADGEDGAFARIDDLTVVAENGTITVTGSPVFGGGAPVSLTDGGTGGAGFGILGATMQQVEQDLVFTMEIDSSFAPLGQYMIPIGATGQGDNQLVAYANDTVNFEYQLANFDDGYASTGITGEVEGSTITFFLPISVLGVQPGGKITQGAEPLHSAVGVSNASVGSVNFGCCAAIDSADWIASPYVVGGGMTVEIVGGDVEEVVKAKVRRGVAAVNVDELPAGTYTVTVTSGFADATFEQVFEVTL